jgi:hypothetical protein
MYTGCYLHLIGGKNLSWYYYYYTGILQSYFGLNPTAVFNQIKKLTPENLYNKKITVKLAIKNSKITKLAIRKYSGNLF